MKRKPAKPAARLRGAEPASQMGVAPAPQERAPAGRHQACQGLPCQRAALSHALDCCCCVRAAPPPLALPPCWLHPAQPARHARWMSRAAGGEEARRGRACRLARPQRTHPGAGPCVAAATRACPPHLSFSSSPSAARALARRRLRLDSAGRQRAQTVVSLGKDVVLLARRPGDSPCCTTAAGTQRQPIRDGAKAAHKHTVKPGKEAHP